MIGVVVLIVLVVLAAAVGVGGAARDAGRTARAREAEARVRGALQAPTPAERERLVRGLAETAARGSSAEAGALVLACRRVFSREVIPVWVAAAGHPDSTVSADACRALGGTGSPGLRAVWRAAASGAATPAALRAFLVAHPDWLFERLVEDFAAFGASSVRAHGALWREAGLLARLGLMGTGSDAIAAIRAREIAELLGVAEGAAPTQQPARAV